MPPRCSQLLSSAALEAETIWASVLRTFRPMRKMLGQFRWTNPVGCCLPLHWMTYVVSVYNRLIQYNNFLQPEILIGISQLPLWPFFCTNTWLPSIMKCVVHLIFLRRAKLMATLGTLRLERSEIASEGAISGLSIHALRDSLHWASKYVVRYRVIRQQLIRTEDLVIERNLDVRWV